MSFQSFVEVTFLQHQDIIFLGDFSPAGHNQRTEEHKLHHSCRRCRQWNNRQTSLRFFGLFFPLLKVWESSWYFVSTATNVAQARRKQRGSSGVRMRIYQAERQFVLNCDWTAAGCTWKWMAALQATHQRLTTPQSAVFQAVNYLCSNIKLASVRWLFWLCLFYYCSIVLFLWLNYAKMSIFRLSFYWLTKLSLLLISFFYYLYLRVWFFSHLSW